MPASALVAARLGLSRSTLYRLFAPNGIVAYIRDRRLMAAMRMLVRDDASKPLRISQVAFAVGFFSTIIAVFYLRFGPRTASVGDTFADEVQPAEGPKLQS